MITFLGREEEGRDGETYKAELLDQNDRTVTAYVKLTTDPRKIIAELVPMLYSGFTQISWPEGDGCLVFVDILDV